MTTKSPKRKPLMRKIPRLHLAKRMTRRTPKRQVETTRKLKILPKRVVLLQVRKPPRARLYPRRTTSKRPKPQTKVSGSHIAAAFDWSAGPSRNG